MQSPKPSTIRRQATPILVALSSLLASNLPAQTAPAAAAPTDDEVIRMSEFSVSTARDYGYRASNSIAGTRTNTPIKDVPLNIQVFTRDLADDLIITNQVDFEAYNASLVYGGADRFSDNPIQQPYQNFLFRGFRQNWGLRDGIREYDPVDAQSLARVEVVKGPAAALYGLAYPGGVMNNITKTVEFGRAFANFRFTGGGEGDWRATVDTNITGDFKGGGTFGVRYNGAYASTKDARAHSEGRVHLQNVVLAYRPTKSTEVQFMAEEGYREKPNGLGWFSTGNEAGAPGNRSDIPLQILHPEIPWTWNWADGKNVDSLETSMYRGTVTQKIGDQFQVQAYYQYSTRLEIPGQGWDANGSGGANAWESQASGYDAATNTIRSTYHYRDWGNQMRAYGATAVYKLDLDFVKNTFAFGGAAWAEKEEAKAWGPRDPLASARVVPAVVGITIPVPRNPPADVVPEIPGPNGNGFHHENNSNDYYFVNWQAAWLNERLKTNIGVNRTSMKLLGWDSGASLAPNTVYEASKVSPLFGVVYEITKEVSVFGLRSTSLFPDTTKDSFGRTFSPQVGKSWEGGVKVDFMEGKISGTLSLFQITQTGGSQSTANHENINTATWDRLTPEERAIQFPGRTREELFAAGDIIQGGEQESTGVELDLFYNPTPEWQIVLSYAHVDHEFTESADPTTIGQTYPQAIRDRFSLLTKYTFGRGPAKGLMLGAGFSGGSKALMDYQTFNGRIVARYEPSRVVGEVFAGYSFKFLNRDMQVQLNVKNILKTPDYTGWKATGSSTVLATERYEVPTPIVYRLTLGVNF